MLQPVTISPGARPQRGADLEAARRARARAGAPRRASAPARERRARRARRAARRAALHAGLAAALRRSGARTSSSAGLHPLADLEHLAGGRASASSTPAAMLVMQERPSTRMPMWRAAITSGTVDMPTASAPSVRTMPDLGGRLVGRAGEREVDALAHGHARLRAGLLGDLAQLRVVGLAHVEEALAEPLLVRAR